MVAILAGVASFLVAFTFDFVSIKRLPFAKQAVVIIVVGLQAYAIFAACWDISRFWLPVYITVIAWILLPLWGLLLLYSLVLELPIADTYSRPGVGRNLVTKGTYALVRHPGVIWYILALVTLLIACRSKVLLIAVPVWAALDVLHVYVQDRFLFPRMFSDYLQYQKRTPMLFPTISSIKACIGTFGRQMQPPNT